MSTVWRAFHADLGRDVAVKVLDDSFSADGRDVRRFMQEARAMSELDHPGIVRGYGADFTDGRYFCMMELLEGQTLGDRLARKSRLPWTDVAIVCESVADALGYAWNAAGIVHCDIKPDNLILSLDGTIKIADLGLCETNRAMHARNDDLLGTPAYISPEQVVGEEVLDCRADIYSLGASLYHLVTGRILFPLQANDDQLRSHVDTDMRAPDPRRFVPTVPASFSHLIAGMLMKNRDERYRSWETVLADVRFVEEGGDLEAPTGVSSLDVVQGS